MKKKPLRRVIFNVDLIEDLEGEEKEVSEMYDFNERKITTYIVDENKVITILRQDEMPEWLKKGDIRVFKDTPEKQKEWKERFETKFPCLLDGHEGSDDLDVTVEVEYFISQLLSERTREVLEDLQKEFSEYGVPDDVRYTHPLFYINDILEKKLSKLLKEEE